MEDNKQLLDEEIEQVTGGTDETCENNSDEAQQPPFDVTDKNNRFGFYKVPL